MSDFGFDAFALDGVDTVEQPHPLEIARDLIAKGKPRSALEVLSLHQDQLADDPEYLLLCAEAWLDDGDALRAQQALLGAARLDAEDPRPLRWLGELLAERGEYDRAERLLAKARALEIIESGADEPPDAMGPEAEHDLIAFAEQQERRHQVALPPRQALLGAIALAGIALLIAAIARIASPRAELDSLAQTPATAASQREDNAPPTRPEPDIVDLVSEEAKEPELHSEPLAEASLVLPSPLLPIGEAELPQPPPAAAPPPPAKSVSRASRSVVPKPTPQATASLPDAREEEPDDAVVEAQLASTDPEQLTAHGDALQARGNPGIAASYYRRALEIDPDYAPALIGMGDSLLRAKMYAEAMKNATRALQMARGVDSRPGLEATAIYQLGRVHFERGEREPARNLFRQSISLRGTPAEAWFYLGEALSSDNSRAAREAYQKYLELVPKGHLANRARRAIQ